MSILANTWKNFIGQCTMLRKNKVSEGKVALEKDFMKWVKADPKRNAEYGNALTNLKNAAYRRVVQAVLIEVK